jgi:Flp pilus assembly protein TadD
MKRCARCNIDLGDDKKFCVSCGGALTNPKLITRKIPRCPSCDSEVERTWKYCEVCAYDLESEPPPAPVVAATQPAPMPETVASRSTVGDIPDARATKSGAKNGSRVFAMIAATVLVIGAAVGGAFYVLKGASSEQKLEEAIKKGNLIAPEGESAYDHYRQLKRGGASRAALAEYEGRVLPQLTARPMQLISEMANPISEVSSPADREQAAREWQEASLMLEWASEIKPDDGMLAARAAYARGRWSYLADRKDEAIEQWKLAADRDKGWGLPPNAIGLIYTERREYQTARAHFNESIKREPNMAQPYNNLGTSYYLDKSYPRNLEEAEGSYLKVVARAPRWARPHNWLGDIYMARGNYRRAEAEYQTAINLARATSTSLNIEEIRKKLDNARSRQAQPAGSATASPAQ